jgi:hypothetical protein
MTEPTMKQVWAGMAMMALLSDKKREGSYEDIASDAWQMALSMEREQINQEEEGNV